MASVTISFGDSSRRNGEISASWIREQIQSREAAGVAVCATVIVDCGGASLTYLIGSCQRGYGARGPQSGCERAVSELLTKHHLTGGSINHGNLLAFAIQAQRL
jgi:hypothetical protein